MESNRQVVLVEPTQVSPVDLQNQAQVTWRPIKAKATVTNPVANIFVKWTGAFHVKVVDWNASSSYWLLYFATSITIHHPTSAMSPRSRPLRR